MKKVKIMGLVFLGIFSMTACSDVVTFPENKTENLDTINDNAKTNDSNNETSTQKYKLTIIDNGNLILDKPKENESYFAENTTIVLHSYIIYDADLAMYVNGEFNKIQNDVYLKDEQRYIWEFTYVMPASDTTLEFKTTGGM